MNELRQAIRVKDVATVGRILEKHPELAKKQNEFGIAPLQRRRRKRTGNGRACSSKRGRGQCQG